MESLEDMQARHYSVYYSLMDKIVGALGLSHPLNYMNRELSEYPTTREIRRFIQKHQGGILGFGGIRIEQQTRAEINQYINELEPLTEHLRRAESLIQSARRRVSRLDLNGDSVVWDGNRWVIIDF